MPTYEYICGKCGHHFDLFQSINDPPLKVCPKEHCRQKNWGKGKVKRAIGGGAGLIFKGSGFYITDYRSEGYKEAAKKEAAAAAPPKEGKSAAGGETKSPATSGTTEKTSSPVKADAATAKPSKKKHEE